MTQRRQRRLDGLGTPQRSTSVRPPSPAATPDEPVEQTEPDPPREPAQPSPTTRARGTKPTTTPLSASGKHRRAVSVPTPLAQQLRDRAQELDRFHTDVVLECLAALAPTLQNHPPPDDPSPDGPFMRPRRRAHRGRTVTTLTLYLSQGEVQAIDELAHTTGHTRSGLIVEALEHHLAGTS